MRNTTKYKIGFAVRYMLPYMDSEGAIVSVAKLAKLSGLSVQTVKHALETAGYSMECIPHRIKRNGDIHTVKHVITLSRVEFAVMALSLLYGCTETDIASYLMYNDSSIERNKAVSMAKKMLDYLKKVASEGELYD